MPDRKPAANFARPIPPGYCAVVIPCSGWVAAPFGVLGKLQPKDATEPARRLALAQHLTRPDHPLTARVLVNRVWQKHFGAGLVDTPSDFGKMGSTLTSAVARWLASEFVRRAGHYNSTAASSPHAPTSRPIAPACLSYRRRCAAAAIPRADWKPRPFAIPCSRSAAN